MENFKLFSIITQNSFLRLIKVEVRKMLSLIFYNKTFENIFKIYLELNIIFKNA
jgi:hypothetical protein